jgi:Family of unknown function (DUF5985)
MAAAEAIYLLCATTSLVAAWLLIRHYRTRRTSLLFWSAISFVGLGINNVMVFVDLALVPDLDLSLPRALVGAMAMLTLLYGLIEGTRA